MEKNKHHGVNLNVSEKTGFFPQSQQFSLSAVQSKNKDCRRVGGSNLVTQGPATIVYIESNRDCNFRECQVEETFENEKNI